MNISEMPGKTKKPDNLKAAFLRWWVAGACYFLVGFGTQLGNLGTPLDLIFALGTVIGLATVFVYNPIAHSAFTIVRRGEIVNHTYQKRRGAKKAAYNLLEVFKSMAIVFAVYILYQQINVCIVHFKQLPAGTVVFPGEPFGFATFYVLIYYAAAKVYDAVVILKQKNQG